MNRVEGGEQTVENSKIGSGSRKRFARPKPQRGETIGTDLGLCTQCLTIDLGLQTPRGSGERGEISDIRVNRRIVSMHGGPSKSAFIL